jgi:polysaccharide biosynthesis/export protein
MVHLEQSGTRRLRHSGFRPPRRSVACALAGVLIFFLIGAALPGLAAQTTDYMLGPLDVVTITVYDQADLSGKFAIEADGTFSFPLIGRVKGGGLTLRALEIELKKRLADGYFRNPQVSVAVEQYRSQRIFIVGEVRTPGTYPLTGDMTLIEAIARAGSATPAASGEVLVVRAASGKVPHAPVVPNLEDAAEVVRVNLNDLQNGMLSKNVRLNDGDTVFVPRAESIYVFGQVKNPGAYTIQQSMTVLQALSLAGGLTDRGADSRIKIIRIVDGQKKELKVKLTDLVKSGDTITVPERFF